MRIAILVNNVELVESTWTTLHLAWRALQEGHSVRFLEPRDYEVTSSGQLVARAYVAEDAPPSREALRADLVSRALPRRYLTVDRCDLLLLRVNPLTEATLNLALLAQERGVPVVNDPTGVARTRAKAWLAGLSGVPRPTTLVTQSRASARLFAGNLEQPVVVKPSMSSGGRAVSLVPCNRPDALDEAMDRAQAASPGPAIIQAYVPEAELGEKRLLWVDGEILGGYLRRRVAGEFRHNLRCGSEPAPCTISGVDRAIGRALRPHLERNGIRIAGLDVIGELLVEVNTLNPGGVHNAEALGEPVEAGAPSIGARIVRALLAPHLSSVQARHA